MGVVFLFFYFPLIDGWLCQTREVVLNTLGVVVFLDRWLEERILPRGPGPIELGSARGSHALCGRKGL